MKYTQRNDEVEITGVSDFDIEKIFDCGQCFRWSADESGAYTGVAFGRAATVRYGNGRSDRSNGSGRSDRSNGSDRTHKNAGCENSVTDSSNTGGNSIFISGTVEDFESVWYDYFALDLDYAEIRRGLCVDAFMRKASGHGAGIRILRQDAWEALCSFIISQCNNIPRIKKIIALLCERFGGKIKFRGREYYSFPSAERLSVCSEEDLAPLHCGYRAAYIISAAKAVSCGDLDLLALSHSSPDKARSAFMTLRGVGNKVADCAVLYGLHMLDSFPLDVWIKRAVAEYYGPGFDPAVYHPFAGVAQQYMYYYIRSRSAGHSSMGIRDRH